MNVGSVRNYKVEICERKDIAKFIEENHYSKNVNGLICDYCFKLSDGEEIIDAMIYGRFAMAGVWKKYGNNPKEVIELRRLCCIDNTPKNTESYFIGYTLRWLKKNTEIKTVISYADNEQGHEGIIYKASNFKKIGESPKGKVIYYEGKRYHDKTIRTKYKGELKPFATKIKNALQTGEAFYHVTKTKNIYKYILKGE
ncbi:MAG: hypothetical protein ACRDAG_01165 [Cetobacterium somerae]|uniref:Mom family adenine methylcarbamoylation protein n=1 Tax=Cetobacterium somerae TaxID=188913 RepID=UPI003F380A70